MKIFLLLSAIPYEKGEAIEVVSHEVVRLMAEAGNDVVVQVLIRERRSDAFLDRERHAATLYSKTAGVEFLPTIYLGDLPQTGASGGNMFAQVGLLMRCLPGLRRRINPALFPAIAAGPMVRARVKTVGPDVIVSIWSWESLEASYDISEIPKFVYYGNPNHKPPETQLRHPELFDLGGRGLLGKLKLAMLRLVNRARELQHLQMMAACETTANNALIDAHYYTEKGHPHSIYLQNMWPEADRGPVFLGEPAGDGLIHICGSVGNLGATGNTFGLYFLGAELVPRIEASLGRGKFVIDVFGGGKARDAVSSVIGHPSIRLRGWVDDINTEIVNSSAFLVLTNVYGFNVGNTRILLAWSLGACVIAHTSSALSMPELEHGVNVLLGETPEELAELVVRVAKEPGLRERIGRGGYETYRRFYRSESVVPQMIAEIGRTVTEFKRRSAH
jgi:hypothetical protein